MARVHHKFINGISVTGNMVDESSSSDASVCIVWKKDGQELKTISGSGQNFGQARYEVSIETVSVKFKETAKEYRTLLNQFNTFSSQPEEHFYGKIMNGDRTMLSIYHDEENGLFLIVQIDQK